MNSMSSDFIITAEEAELRKRGYTLGATLGEGSYAKVKGAYSENHHKRVAVKVIDKRKAPKDFREKFLPRELKVISTVEHPNIIQLFEIIEFKTKVFIIMEHAGHGDLLDYIKLRGALQEPKAKTMFFQLSSAVSYLHTNGVVHRDLKCENLLLDALNNIKVTDFGFARFFQYGDLSKTFCGSAAYAAPEILQGKPYNIPLHDIWSMGVILYIMVCAAMPFDDSNIKKMVRTQIERKVGFPKSRRLSLDLKRLIHAILEANIKKRATVDEILNHSWLSVDKVPSQHSSKTLLDSMSKQDFKPDLTVPLKQTYKDHQGMSKNREHTNYSPTIQKETNISPTYSQRKTSSITLHQPHNMEVVDMDKDKKALEASSENPNLAAELVKDESKDSGTTVSDKPNELET